jgi:hypothetical protein
MKQNGIGIVALLFLTIPTFLIVYGIFMQTLSPLWLR